MSINRFQFTFTFTALATAFVATAGADDAGIAFFERKVRPILVESCYECHSLESGKSKGDLLLDSRDALLKGGELGPAIVPGNPEESLAFLAVTYTDDDLEMPPKKQLSEQEIRILRRWIAMGAPDPRRGDPAAVVAEEEAIDFDEARNHWAFRPLAEPSLPEVSDPEWPLQEIDRFILARLDRDGLEATAPADAATLMRRIYFDLTGLPPTLEQQDAFLAAAEADLSDAFESLVDQLLDSHHFGERWARHWLDVVHYGETFGKPRNFVNPLMWKYRDYVIDAYNADKPFDRFLTEQLAGDLLPADTLEQRREQMVATGMLLTGQRAYSGSGKSPETMEYLADDIDEQLNVIGHAVLGLSIACARCHDHKFDPIPTMDYYALAGILRSTAPYNVKIGPPNPGNHSGPSAPAAARYVAMPDEIAKLEHIGTKHDKVNGMRSALRRLEHSLSKKEKSAAKSNLPENEEIVALRKKVSNIREGLVKLEAELPEPVRAEIVPAVADLPNPVPQPLFIKGDSANHGQVVPRGFLQILPVSSEDLQIPDDQSGRVQLAKWLTSKENPLVARVYVNRVWQHLFGAGLVESADNFGLTGQSPSHEQLLDYLAS